MRFPTEPGWLQAPGPSTRTNFGVNAEIKFATRALHAEIMPLPAEARDEAGFREFVDRESPRFATHVSSVEVFRLESDQYGVPTST